jgi:hypothetical protein
VSKRSLLFLTSTVAGCLAALVIFGCTASRQSGRDDDSDSSLCRRFATLKNAHDPDAETLLGPAVEVSQEPVTPEEAELIDIDTFLRHSDLQVLSVRRDSSTPDAHRFVLVTKGGAAGRPLLVRSGDKVDPSQRVVTNPNLFVEVRDGKLYGIRARINLD